MEIRPITVAEYDAAREQIIDFWDDDRSVRFHLALGFEPTGEGVEDGIPVALDYGGPGVHRAVFLRAL